MNKEGLGKVVVSAQCTNIEEEMIFNQKIFDFNRQTKSDAIKGTSELKNDLPYVLEVLIEQDNIAAFITYLNEFVPEASVQEK